MMEEYLDYGLFLKFFDSYSRSGFKEIEPDNPLIVELDHQMEKNNQLFYIADLILLDIQYISKGTNRMFGIEPENVSLGFFLTTTHPDDLNRHHLARATLLNGAQEFFIHKNGTKVLSSNFRARQPDGRYSNYLYEALMFFSKTPYESVFLILVITDISGFASIHRYFHFYSGNDMGFFRFPDDELLMAGIIFSHTEYRIIELIAEGLSSKEIAKKLFRSVHTINTHRRNILTKSGKPTMTEVIRELKEKGVL